MPRSGDRSIVILGAGPSGLATALGLVLNGDRSRIEIIEKAKRVGGLSGSFRWKDHIVDCGPHRLAPHVATVRVIAESLLGSDCLSCKSQHGVQYHGKLYQFPPRVIDWIDPRSFLSLLAFGSSFFAAKLWWITRRFGADTFESVLTEKFGRKFFREIAGPMSEKTWIHPSEIDPGFIRQRFAAIHPWEVLKSLVLPKQDLNPSTFYYPRMGFQQLWDQMAASVAREGAEVSLGEEPETIEVASNRITRITLKSGRALEVANGEVVSTIPIGNLVGALRGFDGGDLLERVARLKFRSLFLVFIEVDAPKAIPFRVQLYPEKKYVFNRLFEQNAYSRETVAPGKSVVVADITLPRGDPFYEATEQQVVSRVRDDLSKLSYFPIDKISDCALRKVEYAYVVPDRRTRREFHEILFRLRRISNLHLAGRFSVGEYDNSDYAIDNGLTLGAFIAGRITKMEYLMKSSEKIGKRPIVN